MYYFAYIDADNICTGVYQMPTDLSGVAGYIAITEEQYTSQSVVGMRWNAETSEWENPTTYYYAVLNENDIVIEVSDEGQEVIDDYYIRIDELDQTLIGKRYDRETETFVEVQFADIAAHSTDEINVGSSNTVLTVALNAKANSADVYTKAEVDAAISNAGTGSGTPGADGADGEDGGYYTPAVAADGTLSWTASKTGMPSVASANIKGAAGQDGTSVVVGTVTTGEAGTSALVQGVFNEETNTLTLNFTIPRGAQGEQGEAGDAASVDAYTKTEVDTKLSGKADTSHSHDYAPTTHAHSTSDITGLSTALAGKADASHSHSEYASSSHSHSGTYAAYSHTHSQYFSTSGGTITGETNFSGGLLRLKGTQTLYHSGTMITLSSNNVETMIAGSAIYSKVGISVSSDERLKENIADVDVQACIDFVNVIDVKTFNYKGNETPCVGVIAQQLEKLSPELAKRLVTKDENGMLGVKTSDLVFPLIAAVKALAKRVEVLEQK